MQILICVAAPSQFQLLIGSQCVCKRNQKAEDNIDNISKLFAKKVEYEHKADARC